MACVGDNKDGDEDDGGELRIVAVNLVAREQTEDNKVNAIDHSLIDCFSTMELGEPKQEPNAMGSKGIYECFSISESRRGTL